MPEFDNQAGNYKAPRPQKRVSEKAVFSFLLGLSGLALWFFAALPAIVLGALARGDIRRDEQFTGRGIAWMGMFLGFMGLFFAPMAVVMLFKMGSGSEATYSADTDRIVHMHLSGSLAESSQPGPFGPLGGIPGTYYNLLSTLDDMI